MCDCSMKLVEWLDGELPEGEAAEVEQHLQACRECRDAVDQYRKVSGMIRAYGDAALAANEPERAVPNWAPLLGAAASLLLLLALFVRTRIGRSPAPAPTVSVASAPEAPSVPVAPEAIATVTPARKPHIVIHRKLLNATVSANSRPQDASHNAEWMPAGPAIEIAIPGDSVFPPGALPPGVGFVADVNIASDGSAQRVRLYPQLTGFERGPKQ